MANDTMRDQLGLAFFTFAALVSAFAAWEHVNILAWLVALHNAILAGLYAQRKPSSSYDQIGLGLGILAAVLPLASTIPDHPPVPIVVVGLVGYAWILWALLTIGRRFGIAPADRGLITGGPYRFIRHPMYLGELILRAALVITSPLPILAGCLLVLLVVIQILRALREERILSGYSDYAARVRYRLIPRVW